MNQSQLEKALQNLEAQLGETLELTWHLNGHLKTVAASLEKISRNLGQQLVVRLDLIARLLRKQEATSPPPATEPATEEAPLPA